MWNLKCFPDWKMKRLSIWNKTETTTTSKLNTESENTEKPVDSDKIKNYMEELIQSIRNSTNNNRMEEMEEENTLGNETNRCDRNAKNQNESSGIAPKQNTLLGLDDRICQMCW